MAKNLPIAILGVTVVIVRGALALAVTDKHLQKCDQVGAPSIRPSLSLTLAWLAASWIPKQSRLILLIPRLTLTFPFGFGTRVYDVGTRGLSLTFRGKRCYPVCE
jgi:hypothetical protein